MTRSAVTLLFQSKATGALLVMPHPDRSANAMIAFVIGVLKGQQETSPGQSEATPWVGALK